MNLWFAICKALNSYICLFGKGKASIASLDISHTCCYRARMNTVLPVFHQKMFSCNTNEQLNQPCVWLVTKFAGKASQIVEQLLLLLRIGTFSQILPKL